MKHFFCSALACLLLLGCSQTEVSDKSTANTEPCPCSAHSANDGQQTPATNWQPLFDGTTMAGWMVPVYGGDGEVEIHDGSIIIGRGDSITGIRYEKEFPTIDYEIQYEARRTGGYDFFAACTFPVKERHCTFVNGGWGGGVIGLSSINGYDASENLTSVFVDFRNDTWYRFRIRVTEAMIQVWMTPQDKGGNWEAERSIVECEMEDKEVSTRFEMDLYKPLGFCTYSTEGQLRNIEYRNIGK